MPKFQLKQGVNAKGVVTYREPKKSGMVKVVLEEATQAQLEQLAKLKHPFVEEAKASVK